MSQKISSTLRKFNYIEGGINAQYHQISAALGLSDSAFDILYSLQLEGGSCSQSLLYKSSCISRKTAGSSLQKLAQKGILIIHKGETRGNEVTLTEEGRQLVREKIVPVMEAEDAAIASWRPEEREQFLQLNQRYLDAITRDFAKARQKLQQDTEWNHR